MTDNETAPTEPTERRILRTLELPTHPEVGTSSGDSETWLMGQHMNPRGLGDAEVFFRLDAGAGLGNTHLSLLVEVSRDPDGPPDRIWEYVDVTTLVEAWVNRVVVEYANDQAQLAALDEFDDEAMDKDCTCGQGECPDAPVQEHTDRTQDADIADAELEARE